MESEVPRLVFYVLAETVSAIYKTHQHWPQILEWLVSSIASNDDDKFREVALLVLCSLPNDCCFLVCDALHNRRRLLHSSFLISLASSNPNVQVASFGAVVSLVQLFSDPSLFHELLRAMMAGVFTLLHGFEGTYFRIAFVELINLVSQEPLLLKPYVSDMVLDALQIAESEGLTNETHRLAFELVMAMTEVKEYGEHVLLNLPSQTVVRLFLVSMKMLLCIEEDGGVGDHDHDHDFGIKCLKQLCVTLGGSKVLAIASELLPLYLDSKEWKKRHAGITMLTVISKEFSDEMVLMENFLGEVLTKVLNSFQDSHAQVRLAAFNFMETPTNFVHVAQTLYHPRLLNAFSIALDNDQDYKVKEKAASAMLFFLRNTLPESLTMFKDVDTEMGKLLSLLQVKRSVKQRRIALSTFNLVAQRCHEVAHK
ncbi:uncharacterized protein LOC133289242 [Gastrolobium bilobum]|uniref:uncharacterized protein LOC133289242 n=1 Tax=Gastrolobium bilobum TaxID=150636 RepID=UPI002AB2FD34|nr:uncharacterized protein LOC133289242 [Gastrolobium bilobum]